MKKRHHAADAIFLSIKSKRTGSMTFLYTFINTILQITTIGPTKKHQRVDSIRWFPCQSGLLLKNANCLAIAFIIAISRLLVHFAQLPTSMFSSLESHQCTPPVFDKIAHHSFDGSSDTVATHFPSISFRHF